MAIDRIPGVGPQNSDIAATIATTPAVSSQITASVPSASANATAVAAAVPTISAITTAITSNAASAGVTMAAITSTVQANAGAPLKQYTSTFTSTGTFTTPANVNSVRVFLVAGGGSGGSAQVGAAASNAAAAYGGGGGGGCIVERDIAVSPSTAYTITIGAGGTSVTNGNSTQGGNTTFGALATALGGGAGASAVSFVNGNSAEVYYANSNGGTGGGYGTSGQTIGIQESQYGGPGGGARTSANGMVVVGNSNRTLVAGRGSAGGHGGFSAGSNSAMWGYAFGGQGIDIYGNGGGGGAATPPTSGGGGAGGVSVSLGATPGGNVGSGSTGNANGTAGTANTGNGGGGGIAGRGGGTTTYTGAGGAGGSGIAIITYWS